MIDPAFTSGSLLFSGEKLKALQKNHDDYGATMQSALDLLGKNADKLSGKDFTDTYGQMANIQNRLQEYSREYENLSVGNYTDRIDAMQKNLDQTKSLVDSLRTSLSK